MMRTAVTFGILQYRRTGHIPASHWCLLPACVRLVWTNETSIIRRPCVHWLRPNIWAFQKETLVYEVGLQEKRIPFIHRRFFLGGVVRQLCRGGIPTTKSRAVRLLSFAGFIATTKQCMTPASLRNALPFHCQISFDHLVDLHSLESFEILNVATLMKGYARQVSHLVRRVKHSKSVFNQSALLRYFVASSLRERLSLHRCHCT